jgi:hypothetical protein
MFRVAFLRRMVRRMDRHARAALLIIYDHSRSLADACAAGFRSDLCRKMGHSRQIRAMAGSRPCPKSPKTGRSVDERVVCRTRQVAHGQGAGQEQGRSPNAHPTTPGLVCGESRLASFTQVSARLGLWSQAYSRSPPVVFINASRCALRAGRKPAGIQTWKGHPGRSRHSHSRNTSERNPIRRRGLRRLGPRG